MRIFCCCFPFDVRRPTINRWICGTWNIKYKENTRMYFSVVPYIFYQRQGLSQFDSIVFCFMLWMTEKNKRPVGKELFYCFFGIENSKRLTFSFIQSKFNFHSTKFLLIFAFSTLLLKKVNYLIHPLSNEFKYILTSSKIQNDRGNSFLLMKIIRSLNLNII